MGQRCYCPVSLNVTVGLFLIFLSILSFFEIWDVYMPFWLSVLSLFLGIMAIIMNSINRIHDKVNDLSVEKADELHANEGY
ncbi:hypothetical protein HOB10_05215 [Candidatus Parcubacteria bacterium]|jgi:hypothetical protein|nr:hypothetical protein [Candidatus Parcubacteria bacterium]